MEVIQDACLSLKKTQGHATVNLILRFLHHDPSARAFLLHFTHCIIRTYLCAERFNQLYLYLISHPGIRHQPALFSITPSAQPHPEPSAKLGTSEEDANELSIKAPYILLVLVGILKNLECLVTSQGNNKGVNASDMILRFEATLLTIRDAFVHAYNNLTPMFDILYKELAPESEDYKLLQSAHCVRVKYLANFVRDVSQSICYLHSENPDLQKLVKAIDPPYSLLSSPTDCEDARMNHVLEFMTRFEFTSPNFLRSHPA